MSKVEVCLEILEKLKRKAFGVNKSDLSFNDVSDLTDCYQELDICDRKLVDSCVKGKMGLVLIGFTGEFSALAIDTKKSRWLKKAILFHFIEGFKFDYRENIMRLVFIYNAAEEIGADLFDVCE